MDGWIKLHRKMLEWEWYNDNNTKILFLHLLLTANHKEKKWQGKIIERGQKLTSLQHLAEETHLTLRQVRTSLNKLKSTNEIAIKSTNKYTLVTIVKYSDYQNNDQENDMQNDIQGDKQMTNKRQTNDKQMTTNKNEKNNKNDKEIKENIKKKFQKPTIEELKQYCLEKKYNVNAEYFIDYYESNGWKVGKNPMKDWKATVRTWNSRNKQDNKFKKKESNFEQREYSDLSYLYSN